MADEPNVDTEPDAQNEAPPSEPERQCRICLDGEDPELGRLIRPCLCKGSVSYVHVKCLHRWRNSSTSQSAFYRCPQCGYHYRFARTKVVGIASNPIVVGVMSAIAFTILLFLSSFITTWLISGSPGEESYFFISPFDTFREITRSVVCALTDLPCDNSGMAARARRLRSRIEQKGPPSLLHRFLRRLLLGLPTVGAGSIFNLVWSLPFPISHWIRVRLRRSNRSATDVTTLILLTVVIVGAARALMKVYQLTERTVQRLLLRAEDAILEVS